MARMFLIALVCVGVVGFSGTRNRGIDTVQAAAAQGTTTLDDQVDLNVTVYNSDIALVRDVRTLDLSRGTFDLSFMDINNQPVWRIGGEIVTGLHADHIRFPELPDTLFTRPTLIWKLDNGGPTRHRVEAAYLAGKLSWNADYVLTVARDDTVGDIDGWVTLTNGSGTAFRNARLQLVAGDLNRVRQNLNRMLMADQVGRVSESAAAPMAQEAFSDYHLYTLGRKTTINNNETKQVSMLAGTGFPLQKRYVVNGNQFYYHNGARPGAPIKDPVDVFYQFKNEEKGGLGMPMPAGIVRVYQSDSNGGVQFVGEDRI